MLELSTVLWVVLILFISQTVQSTTGFGFGIVAMSMLPLVMPNYILALCTCGLVTTVGSLVLVLRNRVHINYRLAVPLILGNLVSGFLATQLLLSQDDAMLRRLVGAVLIFFSLFSLFLGKRIRIKPLPRNGVIAGLLGGFIGGMFNMGGPPVVVFLLSATDDNLEYLATIQFYFTFSNIYQIVMRTTSGMITMQAVYYSLIGLVAVAAGLLVGGKIFKTLNKNTMQRFVYIFMIVMGLWITIAG